MTSITHAKRTAPLTFVGVALLLFAVAVVTTTAMVRSMSTMRAMPMPGGWGLTMTWTPMHGETWVGAAASFVAMWTVMMLAMMLPSVAPELWRYREHAARSGATHAGVLSAVAGVGYLAIWTTLGVATFPLGALLVRWLTHTPSAARAVPLLISAVVVSAGAIQFTPWKAARLASCRHAVHHPGDYSPGLFTALRHGIGLGLDCCASCANWMAILLVLGVMDASTMVAVTGAITAERLASDSAGVRRVTGMTAIAAAVVLVVRRQLGAWPAW